jgi:Lrp/AsnC family transcriptional regulator for asnA, asnC and gidA
MKLRTLVMAPPQILARNVVFAAKRRSTQGIRGLMAFSERNSWRAPEPSELLDDVSLQIIKELQEDGRRPYTTIAKSVGLSEAAVRQRVQRLLDAGVMQIVAVTDPLRVGLHRQAMVGIRVDGDVREVARVLAASDEIEYVVICSGAFDVLVELTVRDDEHLLETINGQIRSIPGVQTIETFVYLRLEKQTYTWGT